MTGNALNTTTGRGLTLTIAWAATLLVSLLPDILFKELSGNLPAWLYAAKVGLIAVLLLVSLLWKRLRPLWLFFAVLLAVFVLQWGVDRFYESLVYTTWFAGARLFVRDVGPGQILRATTGILLVMVMLVLVRRFDRFFLVKGRLDAPAAPIPLITSKPVSWRILGPAVAGAMCLGLLVFTLAFGSLPSLGALKSVLPLLPFVLLFAASNAFGEEMIYRAPWLCALENPVGPVHALLITAGTFGLAHFYGIPYGILGVVMAFIPGWLMGKAMLETRGFFWAWFIHVCMDIVIFFFMALGSIRPGG
jgi:membrane protease YdiL (CAAX protease family)